MDQDVRHLKAADLVGPAKDDSLVEKPRPASPQGENLPRSNPRILIRSHSKVIRTVETIQYPVCLSKERLEDALPEVRVGWTWGEIVRGLSPKVLWQSLPEDVGLVLDYGIHNGIQDAA